MPTKALSQVYEKNPSAPMFLDKGETTSAKFVALAIPSIGISAQKGLASFPGSCAGEEERELVSSPDPKARAGGARDYTHEPGNEAKKGQEWRFVMHSLSHQKKRISCGSVLLILRPCKCFCSCGEQEHRALRPSNLFIADPNCVM